MTARDRLRVALVALRVGQPTDEDRAVVLRALAARDHETREAVLAWAREKLA